MLEGLLLVFVVSLSLFGYVYTHEQVHVQVANIYGCDSEVDLVPDFEKGYLGATKMDCPSYMSEEDRDSLQKVQAQAEIVGYNMAYFALPVVVLMFLLLLEVMKLRQDILYS